MTLFRKSLINLPAVTRLISSKGKAEATTSLWDQQHENILLSRRGNVAFLTLNRPRKLNALSFEMIKEINSILPQMCEDPNLKCLIVQACKETCGKVFCAGGDVTGLYVAGKEKAVEPGERGTLQGDFFREEFTMNYLLSEMPKDLPQLSLWDGAVFGGGVGLTLHGRFRVATENASLAMPETKIGLFPDDGTSHFYGHLPKGIGNYLGLTGQRVRGAQALFKIGFATHIIPSKSLPLMIDSLVEALEEDHICSEDVSPKIEEVLAFFHEENLSGSDNDIIEANWQEIENIFDIHGINVESIFEELKQHSKFSEFSQQTLETLTYASPTALKVALEVIKRGRNANKVGDAVINEYRAIEKCISRNDFLEGVRALLVDKDKKPHWNPSCIQEVSDESVQEICRPFMTKEYELTLPKPLSHKDGKT